MIEMYDEVGEEWVVGDTVGRLLDLDIASCATWGGGGGCLLARKCPTPFGSREPGRVSSRIIDLMVNFGEVNSTTY